MLNNQFLLATACLFTIAIVSGCATNNSTMSNSEQQPPAEVATEATTATEESSTVAAAETTEAETADAVEATESSVAETPPPISETETTAAVVTEENGVVIIPLGATPPPEEEQQVATPDIPGLAGELATHHNTQWHSRSFTYRLYLGGHLNAEYSEENSALKISAEDDRVDLACEYSTKHGGLASLDEATVSECNKLANELQSYLAED